MKFFATLAIAALAVVSAADVPACDSSLLALATSPDATACAAATGFSAASLKVPAADSLAKVCGDPSCQKLLATVTKAVTTECTLGGVKIKETLVDKFPAACEEVRKAAGGAAGGAAATGSTAGSTAGSSDVEEVEVTASSGSMEADKSSTESPASTQAVPTPSPKTGSASSVVVASSAVLVAAAAALL